MAIQPYIQMRRLLWNSFLPDQNIYPIGASHGIDQARLYQPFLTRLAERRSNDIGLEVEAAQIDDAVPFHFVAQKVLIGAEVAALFASLRA